LAFLVSLLTETVYLVATLRRRDAHGFLTARRQFGLAAYLTMSRGGVAALLVGLVRAFPTPPPRQVAWTAFAAVLWSVTVSDWIDGPIARRFGSALGGTRVDLEADSWLTLWVAIAGVRWQRLPRVALAAPLLRYGVVALTLIRGSYASADLGSTWWGKGAGVAQMAALLLGLAPLPEGRLRKGARYAADGASLLQLFVLLVLAGSAARPPSRR
jgi:phosphatidylglycerophosphate synthase